MRKALVVLTSLAAISLAGCASSANNPWATPDSKPVARTPQPEPAPAPKAAPAPAPVARKAAPAPVAETPAPAPAETPASPDNELFAEDAGATSVSAAEPTPSESLLADFPAIRKENLRKALAALAAASSIEELPMPDKGNARITRFNADVGVIEFITPNEYKVGDRVVLTKENKAALVSVIAIDGNRIVADLVPGVKGAPTLQPADHVLCDIYRSPEELQKIAEEQRKAQREAILAARAAAQAERAALAEEDDGGDDEEESSDEESSDEEESSGDEEASEDEGSSDDEEW